MIHMCCGEGRRMHTCDHRTLCAVIFVFRALPALSVPRHPVDQPRVSGSEGGASGMGLVRTAEGIREPTRQCYGGLAPNTARIVGAPESAPPVAFRCLHALVLCAGLPEDSCSECYQADLAYVKRAGGCWYCLSE